MRRLYRLFFFLCLLLGLKQELHAQSFCGTDDIHRRLLRTNPAYKKIIELQDLKWRQYEKEKAGRMNRPGTTDNNPYEIPVVIHVIHTGQDLGSVYNPSDATLVALIAELNQKYAATWPSFPGVGNGGVNVPIRFKLAQRTPDCQSTNGINRVNGSSLPGYSDYGVAYTGNDPGAPDVAIKTLSIWPNDSYLNVWIVTNIQGTTPGGGGVAAYATFPGTVAPYDGIVLRADQTSWALAHEAGHYFGLWHTFEGSDSDSICPPNNDCIVDGDQVCDTDPHPLVFGCPTGANKCTGMSFLPVTYNIMNYTSCPDRFTAGQADRMVFMLENYRSSLLTSLGGLLPGTGPVTIPTPLAACVPPGIMNPSNGFDIGPRSIHLSTLSFQSAGYSQEGNQYYVDHTVTSLTGCLIQNQPVANLNKGGTYTITVTTGLNPENVRGWIDFNNNGVFQTSERVINSNGTTNNQTHSASFTVPATGVATCTSLRMRIMSDLAQGNPPPQPCTDLLWGQAEDFIVIIKDAATAFPSVTIAANTTNLICEGTSVIFTATPVSGGNNPVYQWKKNGINVGTNSSTYIGNGLVNGDVISCVMTPAACPAYPVVASNVITMSVSPSPPYIGINATPGNMVCEGTNVVFKTFPTNGGSNPGYQWKRNGINIGTNTNTYSSNSLANGDTISCEMTVAETCPAAQTVVSNPITMRVSIPPTGVSVTTPPVKACIPEGINPTPCCGIDINNVQLADLNYYTYESANYTDHTLPTAPTCFPLVAHLTSGDTYTMTVTTSYDLANVRGWIDFNNDGVFQATELVLSSDGISSYQTHTSSFTVPSAGIISCTSLRMRIISGTAHGNPTPPPPEPCSLLPNGGMAMDLTVIISGPGILVPSVSITSSRSYICEGENVTFTATPVNGGNNPTYFWRLNGLHVGTNSNTYSSSTLKGQNEVICIMTSSELSTCNPTATSGSVSMSVLPIVTPTISIRSDQSGPICAGTTVTFLADYTHGALPSFEWKVNGIRAVGSNSSRSYYSTSTLKNGDVVTCEMTSAEPCVTIRKPKSNPIVMEVLGPMPSVTICGNANGTFTATAVNFNPNPSYQWKFNGSNVGTNNSVYTNNALGSGTISCDITGSTACASLMTATSNRISITSDTIAAPEIFVQSDKGNTICTGTSVTFTAIPVNGGINPKYQWKVGNTLVGTNSPTFTMANPTNGTVVTCTLTSNVSCSNLKTVTSEEVTISVIAPPLANVAAAGPLSFCAGKNVLLKAITGTGYTYQWRKDGVYIDNATSSNYTATTAGAYSVFVGNGTGCYATSAPINVIVNPLPLANVAAASALTFCEGKTVQLKAITGTGYTYQWKRGATNIAGATASNYSASASGFYTVIVTNATGCSATSAALAVVVKPLPAATITAGGPTTFCSGKNVLLKANTGTNYTYQWLRGATPIPGATQVNYSATQLGYYSVIVTNSSGCSVTSAAVAISVNPLPVANITPNGPLTFCSGQNVLLKANTGTNYTYQWKKGGINITGANQATYTATASGAYIVVVTNAAGCAVTSSAVTVTVNNAPLATVAAAGPTTFCTGKNVLLKAINAAGYTYQWKKNGINIPNEITSNYSATATGNYSVVVTNATGCSTTSTIISVAVTPAPLATVAVAGPTTFCEGKTVLLKAITGTGYIYQWRKNGINIPLQTQSNYTATATGVYTVIVTNTEGCSTLSTATNVTVTPAPAAVITASGPLTFPQGGNVILNVPAATGNTYQWKKDGVNIAGATTESYTATASGSYIVAVTNTDGCQAISQPTVVTVTQTRPITKGYREESEKITVYPNPLYRSDYLNIDWSISNVGNGIFVTVYDMTGRKINSQRLKPGDSTVKINGASGVYVVELRWGVDKRKTFRVLKVE